MSTIMSPPAVILFSVCTLLRVLVSLHPHSGQDNHHGSITAYGGDYEAQRHWMELTLHLPLSQWYTYDPTYWGLDYPPLIAYGSYVMGYLSECIVGRECVAFESSRGYEDPTHKAFMRGTVIGLDILIYFPAIWIVSKSLVSNEMGKKSMTTDASLLYAVVLTALTQPALVLIDHGHFQYNSVCLGLSILSFYFMSLGEDQRQNNNNNNTIGKNAIIGSVLFCLALNWKQMTLYYAPAVFAFLLGRCFSGLGGGEQQQQKQHQQQNQFILVLKRIGILGITVITTFATLLGPFVYYGDTSSSNSSIGDVLMIILRRIFPFQRGLFEGKVSNLWCFLSIKPMSIRERIPEDLQPILALLLTILMMLPSCIMLFHVGKSKDEKGGELQQQQQKRLKALLWGSVSTSLSFFLASFQVHEKSILLTLSPLSLLILETPSVTIWFSMVATWSLWHLLVVDRLQLAYFCCVIIFTCFLKILPNNVPADSTTTATTTTTTTTINDKKEEEWSWVERWGHWIFMKLVIPLSSLTMISLHILEMFVTPPPNLPDIFPVLWVAIGCMLFCCAWVASLYNLWLVVGMKLEKGEQNQFDSNPTSGKRIKKE